MNGGIWKLFRFGKSEKNDIHIVIMHDVDANIFFNDITENGIAK